MEPTGEEKTGDEPVALDASTPARGVGEEEETGTRGVLVTFLGSGLRFVVGFGNLRILRP